MAERNLGMKQTTVAVCTIRMIHVSYNKGETFSSVLQ